MIIDNYLVFKSSGLALRSESMAQRLQNTLSDGFFIEEMDFAFCRMNINIDSTRVNDEAKAT